MMNNLTSIVQLMRGRDPQQVALQMIKNNNIQDPNILQLVKFAEGGNDQELVNLASSLFQQRGLNLDDEFKSFMEMLK